MIIIMFIMPMDSNDILNMILKTLSSFLGVASITSEVDKGTHHLGICSEGFFHLLKHFMLDIDCRY